jgi:hypothetical protein
MPFQKKHKLGALPYGSEPLDTKPISFKGRRGQRELLKTVPNWQEQLRNFVDQLISELPKNE